MTFWAAGAALVGAGVSYLGSQQQAKAGEKASSKIAANDAATLQQQNALTRQQLELQRPVIQTRDAALNQLNAFFGLPPVKGSEFGAGGAGHGLVALPGVTTGGAHSKQTGTSWQGALLSGGGTAAGVPTGQQVNGGGSGGGMLYYDPSSHTIVDADGNNVANVPQSGQIEGLVSGFNNPVEIDASGQLYAVGSKGRGALGIAPLVPKPASAAGSETAAPFDYNSVLSNPAFEIQRRQGTGVINRNLAAQGKFFSGQRGNALLSFNNDLVRSHINEDYVNPRLTLAGYGAQAASGAQNALAGQSNNIGNYASNYANSATNQANARMSGYAGAANAITSGIGNYLTFREMNGGNGIKTTQPVNRSGYISNFGSGAHYDEFGNYVPGG